MHVRRGATRRPALQTISSATVVVEHPGVGGLGADEESCRAGLAGASQQGRSRPSETGRAASRAARASDAATRCTERQTDAEFPGALRDGVGEDPVNADGGQRQRNQREHPDEIGGQSLAPHLAVEHVRQRDGFVDRGLRNPPDQTACPQRRNQ